LNSRGQPFPMSALIITEVALNQVRVLYDYCHDMAVYLCIIFIITRINTGGSSLG